MNRSTIARTTGILALAALAGTFALAQNQPVKDLKPVKDALNKLPIKTPENMPELKLPPGWTTEDMQACMIAGTPGKMHEFLAKGAGTWKGTCQMWMAPGTEAASTEMTSVITSVMDGRYTTCQTSCDMPGMGPFTGSGTYGYDNVAQAFQATWIDNHSTGIATGTGTLSADQKTLTWSYTMNCPITKKPAALREVQKYTGENTMTMEMFGTDPKSGKEFKMMHVEFARSK